MTRQEKQNRIDTLKRLLEETEGITADEDTENSMATPPHPRYKPRLTEGYYTLGSNGLISPIVSFEENISTDYMYESGNIFHTDKEAYFVKERLKVLAEMREWAGNWNDLWVLLYVGPDKAILPEIVVNGEFTRGEMRFATREDAENCIRAVGADRIIKYYFKISQEEKK